MTSISQLLQQGENKLQSRNIAEPTLDAEVLLGFVLDKSREFLYTYPAESVPPEQAKHFRQLIKRRIKGEPVAYIVGFKDFYGMRFTVNKKVLVPRPETEILVREILTSIPRKRKFNVWDVGTGSGCIAVTLAKILEQENNFKKVYAVDVSKKVLDTAARNARRHQVENKIHFLQSDILSSVLKSKKRYHHAFQNLNIVAANLPYLTKRQFKKSPTIQKEPRQALVAGEKGLKYYRRLLEQIQKLESQFLLILEIDPQQVSLLREMVPQIFPDARIEIKPDLAGRERVAKITIL